MGTNITQNVDGSLGFIDDATGLIIARLGGGAPTQAVPAWRTPHALLINVLGTADTAGALCAVANPFGRSFFITNSCLVIQTPSGAASTLSFGCAANATTSNATLISGVSGAAATIFGSGLLANRQIWTSGLFLTGSTATGASSALVAKLLVEGYVL